MSHERRFRGRVDDKESGVVCCFWEEGSLGKPVIVKSARLSEFDSAVPMRPNKLWVVGKFHRLSSAINKTWSTRFNPLMNIIKGVWGEASCGSVSDVDIFMWYRFSHFYNTISLFYTLIL